MNGHRQTGSTGPFRARSEHPLAYSITTSATRHGSDVGSQHAETIKFYFKVAYFESASSAFGP
jgi:hypothetical protein